MGDVRYGDHQGATRGKPRAKNTQHLPGADQVLQHVTEEDQVEPSWDSGQDCGVFKITDDYLFAEPRCLRSRVRVEFYTNDLAAVLNEHPREASVGTAGLKYPGTGRHQSQHTAVGAVGYEIGEGESAAILKLLMRIPGSAWDFGDPAEEE